MRRRNLFITLLSILISIVFISVGVLSVSGDGNIAVNSITDHPSKYTGTFSQMNPSETTINGYNLMDIGNIYHCDKISDHTHLKLNMDIYVNMTDSTAFYIICGAINAEKGSNIASGISAPNGTTIYISTGNNLEMVNDGHEINISNNFVLPGIARNQTSPITCCSGNLKYEKRSEIFSSSILQGVKALNCVGGETYFQFKVTMEQKIFSRGNVTEQINVGGYTTYYKNNPIGIGRTLELSSSIISENIEFEYDP